MEGGSMNTAGPDPRRWQALALVCVAFFMTVLDVSIVNVALPSIGRSLHFSESNLQWVITAYAITYGGFLLFAGRFADLFGRRRVFAIGLIVFTIASLFCGLAWSESVLITFRAIQGLGAAVVLLIAFVVIEARHKDPLMPFRIFRIRTVAGSNFSGLLLGGIIFANFFLLTLYVQNVLHYSALRTGVTFVATAGSAVAWAG